MCLKVGPFTFCGWTVGPLTLTYGPQPETESVALWKTAALVSATFFAGYLLGSSTAQSPSEARIDPLPPDGPSLRTFTAPPSRNLIDTRFAGAGSNSSSFSHVREPPSNRAAPDGVSGSSVPGSDWDLASLVQTPPLSPALTVELEEVDLTPPPASPSA